MMIETPLPIVACSVCGNIVVGMQWYRLTQAERDAVLAHEQAHQTLKHTRARIWWLLTGKWRGIPDRCRMQELDADQVATLAGHGRGLLRLLSRAHNTPASDFHPSHQERIDNIRKWMRYGNYESADAD